MHVLLATAGSRGDVEPMQALGSALVEAGHEVLLAASPDFEESSRGLRLPFHAMGMNVQTAIREHAAALSGRPLRFLGVLSRLFKMEVAKHFDALMDAGRGADVIVCASLESAAPSVAEALGVPYRYALFAPLGLRSRHEAPWLFPWRHLPGWANRLLWAGLEGTQDRLFLPRINLHRRRLGLAPVRYAMRYILGSRPFLAADVPLALLPRDVRTPVIQTGAWRLPASGELSGELRDFIDAGDPPVYVGFGSMVQREPERMIALVVEAARLAGRRVVISAGWTDVEGALPEGCLGVRSAPHALLFPKVAAAVHHGGAGTTAAAAREGVPQIIVPHLFDQFYWGERVRELGLGPAPVPERRLTTERLAEAIRTAVGDEDIIRRAHATADTLSKVDGAAEAVRVLERDYG